MPLFRKKPVTIEAVQLTASTFDAPHPNPEHIAGVIYDPSQTLRDHQNARGRHARQLSATGSSAA
jgi:hypothetical protein